MKFFLVFWLAILITPSKQGKNAEFKWRLSVTIHAFPPEQPFQLAKIAKKIIEISNACFTIV
jgi:hypothetical protein